MQMKYHKFSIVVVTHSNKYSTYITETNYLLSTTYKAFDPFIVLQPVNFYSIQNVLNISST